MFKKLFIIVLLALAVVSQSEAATTFNFEITSLQSGLTGNNQIFGIEFDISGAEGMDWSFGSFYAPYDGNWDYIAGSKFPFDDAFSFNNFLTYTPLGEGNIFTIIEETGSSIALNSVKLFDYNSNLFEGTFNAELTAVPIPGSILLLGSGLIGLIGLARRKRS